jgi:hypothetical protein
MYTESQWWWPIRCRQQRHSRESGEPGAVAERVEAWVPTFAGMTMKESGIIGRRQWDFVLLGRSAPLLIQGRAKRTHSFSVIFVILPASPC